MARFVLGHEYGSKDEDFFPPAFHELQKRTKCHLFYAIVINGKRSSGVDCPSPTAPIIAFAMRPDPECGGLPSKEMVESVIKELTEVAEVRAVSVKPELKWYEGTYRDD